MILGQSSQTGIRFAKEDSWGTLPGSPTPKEVLYVSDTLAHATEIVDSGSITNTRQRIATRQASASAGGAISVEFSALAYSDWIESCIGGSRVVLDSSKDTHTQLSAITASQATGTITISSVTSSGIKQYDVVQIYDKSTSGTKHANHRRLIRIESISSNTITYSLVGDTGTALTTTGIGTNLVLRGIKIRNGTTDSSYTIQKSFGDITRHHLFSGMFPTGFTVTGRPRQFITADFDFTGQKVTDNDDASATNFATVAAGNNYTSEEGLLFSEVDSFTFTFRDGTVIIPKIASFTFSATKNPRSQPGAGSFYPIGTAFGFFETNFSAECYYEDNALFSKITAGEKGLLSFRMKFPDNKFAVFDLFEAQTLEGTPSTPSADSDLFLPISFRGVKDKRTGGTSAVIQVSFFDA